MKRADLLRRLEEEACVLERSTGPHDVYRNILTGRRAPVPRHREINEFTARAILRVLAAPSRL
ncbi:MAG: type II toxin-antitoxin system HicA family toxin [Kiritimatiellia bacterium]